MEKRKMIRGMICALSGGILWGLSGTVGQYLFTYKGIGSQWLTVVRMLAAGTLLLAFALARDPRRLSPLYKTPGDFLRLNLFALLGLLASQYT